MTKRDPRDVLGVSVGASANQIKAAWRRLARANHPDLTGDDPAASRSATRRMAEINDAYAALTRDPDRRRGSGAAGRPDTGAGATFEADGTRRRGGPPPPRPTRPVTGRVDTTATYRPRNQPLRAAPRRSPLAGQPPIRGVHLDREPPRASTPTGPLERARVRHFRRPPAPSLQAAQETVIRFGKFHDHTLGEIAAFEPSYIDWVASTVQDPDLVAAARVIQAELDRRGVIRRTRPSAEQRTRTA